MSYKEQYQAEQRRLVETLGKVTEGGIVESIRHIGSTSVPGLSGSFCVDIALAVWPFPLEEHARSRLEAIGYRIEEGFTERPQQRFRHTLEPYQLFVFEPGMEAWLHYVLTSDYLRHSEKACKAASNQKDRSIFFAELLPEAQGWWMAHYAFSPVETVAAELRDAPFAWFISGGWALDLFLESLRRVHHDVDVIVPRRSQLDLQKHLAERGWKFVTPFEKRLEPWPPHMRLELPRHQVHAHRGDEFIDFLLTDMEDVWRYRREPSILRAREKMSLVSKSGIPYLAPELVLLFKSKNTSNRERAKDQPDFEKILPRLDPERRAWLYWALMATDPDHAWIKQLAP